MDVVKYGGLFFCPSAVIVTAVVADSALLVRSLATTVKVYWGSANEALVNRSPERGSKWKVFRMEELVPGC